MKWEAYSLDHTDERFGVGRSIVVNGKYQLDKYHRTFKSMASAMNKAKQLNEEETNGNQKPIR